MKTTDNSSKHFRILEMYLRLLDGEKIVKREEAQRYGVDERSIQRDIEALRTFLNGQRMNGFSQDVVYDWKVRGYVLQGNKKDLSREEALALCKILLESRAFTKDRIEHMVNEIIESAVPRREINAVQQLVNNETQYYEELKHHDTALLNKIWAVGEAISARRMLHMEYKKATGEVVERTVKPLSIMFSEYYFYLIAEQEWKGTTPFTTVYRLDRIQTFEPGDTFKREYSKRFQSGEVRKRILYMFAGRLEHVVFTYVTASSVEHVLDRLPTAKINKTETLPDGRVKYTISAEVYGLGGLILWMLSQGSQLCVLSPDSLRDKMKRTLAAALAQYCGDDE